MKYAVESFGLNAIAVRLHSLVAGILLIPTIYLLTILWVRDRYVATLAALLAATHGGLIYFSQIARGYSLETFLIVLFALLSITWLKYFEKLTRTARWSIACSLILAMVVGCMTLCTAILFIVPVMLYQSCLMVADYLPGKDPPRHKLLKLVRKNIELLTAWLVITAFATFLYIGNYDKFTGAVPAAGGMVENSPGSFVLFLKDIFSVLMPYWLLLPIVFAFFKTEYRKVAIFIVGLCAFAFSTVFFAKGGPVRVYLPLVPFFCIGVACGFQTVIDRIGKRYQRLAGKTVLVALSVVGVAGVKAGLKQWGEPDGKADFRAISKLPVDHMVVYTACYSMPMAFNNRPKIYRDNFNRISNCRDGSKIVLLRHKKNHISVLNDQQSEVSIPLNVESKKVVWNQLDIQEYELQELQPGDNARNRVILAVVPFNKEVVVNAAMNYLQSRYDRNWLLLNCWFYEPISQDGTERYSAVALIFPPQPEAPVAELVKIEEKSGGKSAFFKSYPLGRKTVNDSGVRTCFPFLAHCQLSFRNF